MHAPLNPNRVVLVFIYLGIIVETLTAAGASLMAGSKGQNLNMYARGGTLLSISLVLQAVVESTFMSTVVLIHYRASRARMLSHNVRFLCIMLYGTSALILFRCIYRAIEAFSTEAISSAGQCGNLCRAVLFDEWYLYAFEAVPMALYTIWLNIMHPGKYLPRNKNQYLDLDGKTERIGPGWIDRRSKIETYLDPFDIKNTIKGHPAHEKFWLESEKWPVATDAGHGLRRRGSLNKHEAPARYRHLNRESQ